MIINLTLEQIAVVCQGMSRFGGDIVPDEAIKRDPKIILEEIREAILRAEYTLDISELTGTEALLIQYALCLVTGNSITAELISSLGTFDVEGVKADIRKKLDPTKLF